MRHAQGSDTNIETCVMQCHSQAGLNLWAVRANRTKMQRTALTALEPLVFPRISNEITLVLPVAVDGIVHSHRLGWVRVGYGKLTDKLSWTP